ncbi:MAG: hypothetical protein RBR78_00515 [Flavobacteriaceae bacterium]|jgi:hypothetical protein|nr:hypothetical protein [Flavobacteriaceae bacterium]
MKKIFLTFVMLILSGYISAENMIEVQRNNKIFNLTVKENTIGPKYTCTVSFRNEDGTWNQWTATSDVSPMDACNKALRHTQTNNALED